MADLRFFNGCNQIQLGTNGGYTSDDGKLSIKKEGNSYTVTKDGVSQTVSLSSGAIDVFISDDPIETDKPITVYEYSDHTMGREQAICSLWRMDSTPPRAYAVQLSGDAPVQPGITTLKSAALTITSAGEQKTAYTGGVISVAADQNQYIVTLHGYRKVDGSHPYMPMTLDGKLRIPKAPGEATINVGDLLTNLHFRTVNTGSQIYQLVDDVRNWSTPPPPPANTTQRTAQASNDPISESTIDQIYEYLQAYDPPLLKTIESRIENDSLDISQGMALIEREFLTYCKKIGQGNTQIDAVKTLQQLAHVLGIADVNATNPKALVEALETYTALALPSDDADGQFTFLLPTPRGAALDQAIQTRSLLAEESKPLVLQTYLAQCLENWPEKERSAILSLPLPKQLDAVAAMLGKKAKQYTATELYNAAAAKGAALSAAASAARAKELAAAENAAERIKPVPVPVAKPEPVLPVVPVVPVVPAQINARPADDTITTLARRGLEHSASTALTISPPSPLEAPVDLEIIADRVDEAFGSNASLLAITTATENRLHIIFTPIVEKELSDRTLNNVKQAATTYAAKLAQALGTATPSINVTIMVADPATKARLKLAIQLPFEHAQLTVTDWTIDATTPEKSASQTTDLSNEAIANALHNSRLLGTENFRNQSFGVTASDSAVDVAVTVNAAISNNPNNPKNQQFWTDFTKAISTVLKKTIKDQKLNSDLHFVLTGIPDSLQQRFAEITKNQLGQFTTKQVIVEFAAAEGAAPSAPAEPEYNGPISIKQPPAPKPGTVAALVDAWDEALGQISLPGGVMLRAIPQSEEDKQFQRVRIAVDLGSLPDIAEKTSSRITIFQNLSRQVAAALVPALANEQRVFHEQVKIISFEVGGQANAEDMRRFLQQALMGSGIDWSKVSVLPNDTIPNTLQRRIPRDKALFIPSALGNMLVEQLKTTYQTASSYSLTGNDLTLEAIMGPRGADVASSAIRTILEAYWKLNDLSFNGVFTLRIKLNENAKQSDIPQIAHSYQKALGEITFVQHTAKTVVELVTADGSVTSIDLERPISVPLADRGLRPASKENLQQAAEIVRDMKSQGANVTKVPLATIFTPKPGDTITNNEIVFAVVPSAQLDQIMGNWLKRLTEITEDDVERSIYTGILLYSQGFNSDRDIEKGSQRKAQLSHASFVSDPNSVVVVLIPRGSGITTNELDNILGKQQGYGPLMQAIAPLLGK